MQRSCFALAVLLGSMASSVLVVGSVHSQPAAIAVTVLPGPASIGGFVTGTPTVTIVLGQSVDADDDRWWEETGGADRVASDDVQQRDADASLATEDPAIIEPNHWWNSLGTGYDSAYDFAMYDGWYDVESSQTDVEHSVALEESFREECEGSYFVSGPTSSVACEDYDHCIDGEPELGLGTSRTCPWSGQDLTDDDAKYYGLIPCLIGTEQSCEVEQSVVTENSPVLSIDHCSAWILETSNLVVNRANSAVGRWYASASRSHGNARHSEAPTLLSEECVAWILQQARIAFAWTDAAARRSYSYANDGEWAYQIRDQWTAIVAGEPSVEESTVTTSVSTNEPDVSSDFHEEVLLLTTANTLDHLSLRLQEAAQYLRYWAADCVASKTKSRRVANRAQ
jgi:hypothetical protein